MLLVRVGRNISTHSKALSKRFDLVYVDGSQFNSCGKLSLPYNYEKQ